ncbi:MAG: DUF222 domain-containing protein, partial [Acidimicrobiales bacterium]
MGIGVLEREGGEIEVRCDGPEVRLCAAMGVVNAATAEVVAAIAEALEDPAGWQGDGIVSPEHWVALRCGVTSSRARRLVAMARALATLPSAAAAFATGALSEDQANLVCAHVDPAHDDQVTELARRCTVSQLRRILPTVAPPPPVPDPTPDRQPLAGEEGDAGAGLGDTPGRREVAFGNGEDGRWWARMLLPPDEGALVQTALEAARDSLFRARHPGGDGDEPADTVGWADAVVHLADAALSGIEGTGRLPADRYQVVVHVDADHPDRARLHLGPLLPGSLRDYLSCDATGRVVAERHGTPVHVFARRRTVDDRLRRLVEQRDGGCRVPGCGARRGLHVHHLEHWEDGGLTIPSNVCSLCPAHHRLHHAGRLGIAGDPTTADGLVFTDHRGR